MLFVRWVFLIILKINSIAESEERALKLAQ